MGQWLSAIGGYTVEQVGGYITCLHLSFPDPFIRLLSERSHSFRNRIHARLRYLDRLHTSKMARTRVHVLLLHSRCDLYPCVE